MAGQKTPLGELFLAAPALAFGVQAFTATLFLEPIAADFQTNVAAVGAIIVAFALSCAVSGPVLTALLGRAERRGLLVAALLALGVFNIAAAFAPNLLALTLLRAGAGLAGGLIFAMAGTIAAAMGPPAGMQARMARVSAGMPLAFLIGVPFTAWAAAELGWRFAFWGPGILCILVGVLAYRVLPAAPSPPPAPAAAYRAALFNPSVGGLFLFSLLTGMSTFAVVAFIGPIGTASAGLTGAGLGLLQMAVGFGALLGVTLAGGPARRLSAFHMVGAALAFLVLSRLISLFLLSPPQPEALWSLPLLLVSLVIGAGAMFGLGPLTQTLLMNRAGPAGPVALALSGSTAFVAQGLAALVSGVAIGATGGGYAAAPLVGIGFAALAILLAPLAFRVREPAAQAG